jgi:Transposase IS116/IS110/IS902 family
MTPSSLVSGTAARMAATRRFTTSSLGAYTGPAPGSAENKLWSSCLVTISAMLAAFGEDRGRFDSARDIQCASGVATVLKRSGDSKTVHMRYRCAKFIRQTFVEWAGQTIPKVVLGARVLRPAAGQGATHQVAVRALAFKWFRILFRVWKDRVPYDENRYLQALKKRRSSLLKNVAAT